MANSLDDFKKFLSDQLHFNDDFIINYTHCATIRVISDNNTAAYKALAIVSLISVTVCNGILSVWKRLKGTSFYVHPEICQEKCKKRVNYIAVFLDARANNEKSLNIGPRLHIGNIILGVSDAAFLTIRYHRAADMSQ